jgi:hypothetical protein
LTLQVLKDDNSDLRSLERTQDEIQRVLGRGANDGARKGDESDERDNNETIPEYVFHQCLVCLVQPGCANLPFD